jgi:hypothetical protein
MTRPLCPFYGFSWPENTCHLLDEGDNGCGLDFGGRNICAMERAGISINYRACQIYLRFEHVANIGGGHIVMHPNEFPQGILLRQWINHLSRQA